MYALSLIIKVGIGAAFILAGLILFAIAATIIVDNTLGTIPNTGYTYNPSQQFNTGTETITGGTSDVSQQINTETGTINGDTNDASQQVVVEEDSNQKSKIVLLVCLVILLGIILFKIFY